MRKGFIFWVLLLMAYSCNNKPKDILPVSKMKAVLWDYVQADVYSTDYLAKDTSKNVTLENAGLQKTIFNFHHVTKEQFYKSYAYYLQHGDILQEMLDSMIAQKNRGREKNLHKLKKFIHE
ncbi:MAG: DUF4296 domain-containing protein [Bacteroidetes bacterium]|nr:DUF4296 domain-containing protein [Bacteroidota bacterium]MBS1756970.1 DUF4296 domain-containing protein [Bacteroidota bacterium]